MAVSQLSSKLRRSLLATHRLLGQAAAVVVVVLALTGVALNHQHSLGFLDGSVRWEPLLDWYGLAPEGELVHFAAHRHNGVSLERGIYLDGRYLTATESPLLGVTRFQHFLAFATRERLMLIDPDPSLADASARIVDQMDSASLPGAINRVGRSRNQELAVRTDVGSFKADADLLQWQPIDPARVIWSAASAAPDGLRAAVLREFRGGGIPRTRIVADLHSGRIFGRYGPWLMDASAIILLLLVATGIMRSRLARRGRSSTPAER